MSDQQSSAGRRPSAAVEPRGHTGWLPGWSKTSSGGNWPPEAQRETHLRFVAWVVGKFPRPV